MVRQKFQSSRKNVTAKNKPGNLKFGLLGMLVVAAAVAAYVLFQLNQYKQGGAKNSNSIQLSESEKQKSLTNFFGKKIAPTVTIKPLPTVVVIPTIAPLPLPKGPQQFSISMGPGYTGPKFVEGTISEYTMVKNVKQTVDIYIDKINPATQVTGFLNTDNKSTPLTFTLVNNDGALQKWQAVWMLDDSINKRYGFGFEAIGAGGKGRSAVGER